jgi:NAD(P)-dependent dehydrogenase (short-subunit alcohol dehydrogenase family)
MDTNFIGLVALTQKFLPLLRVSHGRIVNVSALSVHSLEVLHAAEAASKAAMEAFSGKKL